MSCHYAQLTVCCLALGAAVLSGVALGVSARVARWVHAVVAAIAVVAAFVPGPIIHLCMMDGMRCRAIMRPAVILLSIVICACAVVCFVLEGRQARS